MEVDSKLFWSDLINLYGTLRSGASLVGNILTWRDGDEDAYSLTQNALGTDIYDTVLIVERIIGPFEKYVVDSIDNVIWNNIDSSSQDVEKCAQNSKRIAYQFCRSLIINREKITRCK